MNGLGGLGAIGPAGRAGMPGGLRTLRDVEPHPSITLTPTTGTRAEKPDFGETLAEVLSEVNGLELRAGEMISRLASGQVQDLHEVVIAQQEAAIAFQLVQEIRDKLLQGYQEIMRMQV